MSYVVTYKEYDLLACRVVRTWQEETDCGLSDVERTTFRVAGCEAVSRERAGPRGDCCDGLFPPEESGSGSGQSPPDPHILEYTTYDLANCVVVSKACAYVPACEGDGPSGSGSSGDGGDVVDVSACLPSVGVMPFTLYLIFVTLPALDPFGAAFFSQAFPLDYQGPYSWAGTHTDPTNPNRGVTATFALLCDPDCHAGAGLSGLIRYGGGSSDNFGPPSPLGPDGAVACSYSPLYVEFTQTDPYKMAVTE